MVYRDDAGDERFDGDAGIVHELAHQFADPHAYLRELIQNALDAGASEIRVGIHREDEAVVVRVRDDGCGMTPAMLEDDLLVLFRSSKEGRTDAIGKFGVGFVSVFAVGPTHVTVQTSRGEGKSWSLKLTPDLRYEIFETPGGSEAGTSVALRIPLEGVDALTKSTGADPYDAFSHAAVVSLRRWCRHVHRPVHLHVASDVDRSLRIDEPFALDDVFVQVEVGDEDRRIVVGITRAGAYAGFFKRGLTLLEMHSGLLELPRLAFKVDDPALEHTISRDDVVRNAAFAASLVAVEQVARARLGEAMQQSVEALARAASFDASEYEVACVALFEHADTYRVDLRTVGLRRWVDTNAFGTSDEPELHGSVGRSRRIAIAGRLDEINAALVSAGYDVLHGGTELASWLVEAFEAVPAEAFTLHRAVERDESDELLLAHTTRLLGEVVGHTVGVKLVSTSPPARDGITAVSDGDGVLTLTLRRRVNVNTPSPRLSLVYLDPRDAVIAHARLLADTDVPLAGALLARAILARFDCLDGDADARWLEASIEALGAVG